MGGLFQHDRASHAVADALAGRERVRFDILGVRNRARFHLDREDVKTRHGAAAEQGRGQRLAQGRTFLAKVRLGIGRGIKRGEIGGRDEFQRLHDAQDRGTLPFEHTDAPVRGARVELAQDCRQLDDPVMHPCAQCRFVAKDRSQPVLDQGVHGRFVSEQPHVLAVAFRLGRRARVDGGERYKRLMIPARAERPEARVFFLDELLGAVCVKQRSVRVEPFAVAVQPVAGRDVLRDVDGVVERVLEPVETRDESIQPR